MENIVEYCIDTQPISRYEVTEEGYIRLWVSVAVADKNLEYMTDSGDKRIEYINVDSLFDKKSLNSAMGKPFTINHPPEPVLLNNYSSYAKGTSLQEFVNDDNRLVLSGLVTDPVASKKIIDKEIRFTSSAYKAIKEQQIDGRWLQKSRHYNHFALLTEDEQPRAGVDSRIILDSTSTYTKETLPMTTTTAAVPVTEPVSPLPIVPTPSTTPSVDSTQETIIGKLFGMVTDLTAKVDALTSDSTKIQKEVEKNTAKQETEKLVTDSTTELVSLWSEWKSTIEKNNKTVDYALDSMGVKKLILSCFYQQDTIDKLTDKAVLDGFWINFEANKEVTKKAATNKAGISFNGDSCGNDHRLRFIEQTTKKTA